MKGLMISNKMVTQILLLLSLSISSLVFSYTLIFSSPFLLYSQQLYYYLNYLNNLQILTRAADKNCIFLICNTLFFIVAKTSGSVALSPPDSGLGGLSNDFTRPEASDDAFAMETERMPIFEKDIIVCESRVREIEKVEEEEEEENHINIEENEGGKELAGPGQVLIFIAESDEEGEEDRGGELVEEEEGGPTKSCCLFPDEEGDGDEYSDEDEDDVFSREELNRKFEDFIRRMKEEIRLGEARKQLVVLK